MAFDWKSIIKTVAPTLGAALGGPVGGVATKFLADQFLGNPDATEDDLEAAIIGASPEQLATLKSLDNDFRVKMKQLDIDVFKLEKEDRDSARQMFKVNIWPQIILSAVFVTGYFIILHLLISAKVFDGMDDKVFGMVTTIIGVLTAVIPQINNFWFGSSSGSKDKTAKATAA